MEFRILGPLEIRQNGNDLPLGGPKQRALLALLLLHPNEPVSRDRLIEELWGDDPSAGHALEIQISRLRKTLGGNGDGTSPLETRAPGYLLRVEPGALDLERFEELLRKARRQLETGDHERAAKSLREADALWRGRALADVAFDQLARVEIDGLEESRLAAIEERIDAELAIGRHARLVPELESLVARHPLRERLRAQQMLALYRCGRQADALDAYRATRAVLVEELGLEPGPQLKQLEQAILRHDPVLDLAAPEPAAGSNGLPPPPPTVVSRRRRSAYALGAMAAAAAGIGALLALTGGGGGTRHLAPAPPRALPAGVSLVDAHSGRSVKYIPELAGAATVLASQGDFWTVNQQAHTLARVDARSGRVIASFASPVAIVGRESVAIDGNLVWVADWSSPNIYALDARTGYAVRHFRVSHRRFDTRRTLVLGVIGPSLWVGIWRTGELLRLDKETGRVLARLHGFQGVDGGHADGDALWVSTPDALTRIDTQTNRVTAVAKIPGPHQNIAVGGGYAWCANPYRGESYKVDPRGRLVATYKTGLGAWRNSFSAGSFWVANSEAGTVSAIDAATGVVRSYRFGRVIAAAAVTRGRMLVIGYPFKSVVAVPASMKKDGARLIVPPYIADPSDPATGGNSAAETSGVNPFMFQIEHATQAGLLGYPDAPPPAGLRLRPELAAAMPSVSRDGRTYTFRVRGGYRFSPPSGAPVTAHAVRDSIERALSPSLGIDAPGISYLGDVAGARAFHAGRARHVRGLRAHGSEVQITLTRASADFLERLSLPYFAAVPSGSPTPPNGETPRAETVAPPSAGPYFMSQLVGAAFIILQRNPYYHGPRPHKLATISFFTSSDAEGGVADMLRDRFDGVELPDPALAPGGAVARRFGSARGGVTYTATQLEQTRYIALDARHGPFADARLRRAAAHALSRNDLAAGWGVATDGDPNTGHLRTSAQLLPANVRGYRRATPYPLRADLADAGVRLAHPVVARMAVPIGCDECRASFETVRAALAPIGIRVRARAVVSLASVHRHPGSFDLYDGATGLPYPDPASFLVRMLGQDVPAAWLPAMTRRSVNALERLRGSARDTAAVALAARLERRDVPVVAYGHPVIGQAFSSRLGCRVRPGFEFGLDLAALCVKQ